MSTATEIRLATRPAWLAALLDALERHLERRNRVREARRTLDSLTQLDAQTLRDIGLDASELSSVALEASRGIETTRSHPWHQHRAPR